MEHTNAEHEQADTILKMLDEPSKDEKLPNPHEKQIFFMEEITWTNVISGYNFLIKHGCHPVCYAIYYTIVLIFGVCMGIFLSFSWILPIIALVYESPDTTQKTFYIFTIILFWSIVVALGSIKYFQKKWNSSGTLGESNIVSVIFTTTIVLCYFSKNDTRGQFGQIIFWTYVVLSIFSLLIGTKKIFDKVRKFIFA